MNELYELLNDDQRREVSEAAKAKILSSIAALDTKTLESQIKILVEEDVRASLESNMLTDSINWSELGAALTGIISNALSRGLIKTENL